MNKQRPKNLNLLTIRFPLPAIVSILHRISGVISFLMIPVMLWALETSLNTEDSYNRLHDHLTTPLAKCLIWLFLAAFIYHFVAGLRHLLMDINIGVELKSGRLTAMITLGLSVVLILLAGIYLW